MSCAIPTQISRDEHEPYSETALTAFPMRFSGCSSGRSTPLSFAQEQIWRDTKLTPGISLCNRILLLKRAGPLELGALQQSFREIIQRHEILRTTFPVQNEKPAQLIAGHQEVQLSITDLGRCASQQREAEVLRIAWDEERRSFDLGEGPLLRARLLRLPEQDHFLLITLHPIIADELSLNILARELDVLSQAYSRGENSPLPGLPFQYSDYADWQRRQFQGDVLEREISYWRERLAAVPPVLELPTDRPRTSARGFHGACHILTLSKDLSELLKSLSDDQAVPLSTTLLAAFQSLLSRYTAQDDIVIGAIVPGRHVGGTEGLIGLFAQTTALRTDVAGDLSFYELLQRVRDALQNDSGHQNVPFDCLAGDLQLDCDLSRNPFFRVLFSFTPGITGLRSGWKPASFETSADTANVDVHLQLYDGPEGIAARFTYDTELFDPATIRRMGSHFQSLLESVIADPGQPVSRLSLLTSSERRQVLFEWNDTRSEYPRDYCVHQLFEEQAGRTPDAIALVFEDQQLTYSELNNRANQLACHLLKLGVGPEVLVGICTERCPDMVVGLLGILKAGGAYVPLDPQYPSDRLSLMLQDSELSVLVTQTRLRTKFSDYHGRLVCLDSYSFREESVANFPNAAKPENLAYVIYTSGSTGKPKGVQINHRSLVNFLASMRAKPGLGPEDTLLAVTTISFDIAGLELYLPLIVGARLVLASRETAADGHKLQTMLLRIAPTVMQATPATWRLLLEAGWQGSNKLKVLCGGEATPRDLALELLKRASSVWNMYGPTETTIWSTVSQITPDDDSISIGRPIANTDVYVLDSHLEPVPMGVAGELYIGGDGVARGYLHRPDLTAEKFIPHPFRNRDSEERLYRTGDLARYRANGELECLGRTDNQVKVRGFRIELGEIESVLSAYPGVRQNVVVAREHSSGDKRLVAYVVCGQTESISADSLRESLKQKLPAYMLPSRFIFLEALPLTPNGKVDRKALPAPDEMELTERKEYIAARDNTESRLVKIWESVLGVHPIGIQENFFDLGGHSLLVAKLVRRVEQDFGTELSMAAIFEAPTIEQQASTLRDGKTFQWPSAIIPVQPRGSKPPFFCFGYAAGPVFLPLARRLGSDQPLLGVDPLLLDMSQLPTPCKMEDVAACLAKQIRELHPNGPYHMGGFCGGGLVAYATASELIAQGQKIGTLALFEPHTSYYNWHSNGSRNAPRRRMLKFHIKNLQEMNFKLALAYIRHRARVHSLYLHGVVSNALNALQPRVHNGRAPDIREILTTAYHGYRAQPFAGPVTLFQATRREPGGEWERQYWAELAATFEVYEVPGYSNWLPHFFLEPSVGILANKLQDTLGSRGR
jgi:amino acid adenylation domain-containing protein